MKLSKTVVFACGVLTLGGCASWQAPSVQALRELPIVEFGNQPPTDREFILHFAAGKPIRTSLAIQGNIFGQEAEGQLDVKLRRDIYVYRDWISFDRANWIDGKKALGVKVEIRLPGYDHPIPGYVHIRMDLKPGY